MLTSKGSAMDGTDFRMGYSQWFKRVCSLRTDTKSSLRPAAQIMECMGEKSSNMTATTSEGGTIKTTRIDSRGSLSYLICYIKLSHFR